MLRLGVVGGPDAAVTAVTHRLRQLGAAVVDGPAHLVIGLREGADADVVIDGPDAVDALWASRLEPFATNLRLGRRAPRRQTAELSDPQPGWSAAAQRLIGRLDAVVGRQVRRIDHIGSTSVPGLPAKDIVDIQVVVNDLVVAARVAEHAPEIGFVRVPGEWFGEDRFGRRHREEVLVDADPGRPTNVNIRPVTAPVWRETLLFRDWLRSHPDERDAYAAMKRVLAGSHVDAYSDEKRPWIHAALARAEGWAATTGWRP
jgi:dephospho-CoA kinase